ncbi:hypothetical protein ARTHRO8AJ_290019 [Arthrobacter sp. 8AJ]|nr:hypothetical protein ARTHRO8AJ_290019 [Arthrobacter sp. 8AJ]
MSSSLPRPMNRCKPPRGPPDKTGSEEPYDPIKQHAEGPPARVLDPPPTHLHTARGGQATARDPTRQATRPQALYTRQSKIAPDEAICRARGGTRTHTPFDTAF